MNKLSRIAIPILAAAATIATAFAASPRGSWDDDAARRKIDYLYMESERQSALGNRELHFNLMNRAYLADTSDLQIGSEVAYYYISMGHLYPELGVKGFEMLNRYFQANPSDLVAGNLLGNIASQAGNIQQAISIWHTLDSIYPERLEVKLQYAQSLMASGDSTLIPQAIEQLNKIEVAAGPNAQLTQAKANAYMDLGMKENAKAEISRLLAEAPLNVDNYILAGGFYDAIEMPDSAIYYLDRACQVDSTSGIAYYTRADYYREKNDSAAFRRETTHALLNTDLEPDVKHDILLNYLREFYADTTQFAAIDSLMQQVVDRNPHEFQFRDLYSSFLSSSKRFSQAAEQSDAALDIDPSDNKRWASNIVLHSLAGEFEPALKMSERALSYFPDDGEIFHLRGSVYLNMDRCEDAVREFQKAYELADSADLETRSELMGSIADTYHKMGQRDTAMTIYDKALELNPGNMMVKNNMAYFMAVDDIDLPRAKELSESTVLADPENTTYLDTLAWVLFKLRDYAKAKELIDKTMALEETPSAEILEHAGDIYFMSGDPEKAIDFWKQALPLDPDNDLLRRKVDHKTYFYK